MAVWDLEDRRVLRDRKEVRDLWDRRGSKVPMGRLAPEDF